MELLPIVVWVLFIEMAVFQVLLSLGFLIGECAMQFYC
ncbi:hypothetical protein BN988_03239 [Oceanobacillus picturae]|uniref:Uncharacterized protein n=1 Tax=Oceanobacillus picturae TaxID=171693 RepID=W9AG35_9BACI|nr:hypothetical protein BN988_03239 [Oceanobacillus picturae]